MYRTNNCRECQRLRQEVRGLEARIEDLEEGREFFKSASLGRSFTIEAVVRLLTGVEGGRALDLMRLAKWVRERYGVLPADVLK